MLKWLKIFFESVCYKVLYFQAFDAEMMLILLSQSFKSVISQTYLIFDKELVSKGPNIVEVNSSCGVTIKLHSAAIKSKRDSIAILLFSLIDFLPPL